MTTQETIPMSPSPATPPAAAPEDGTDVRPDVEALYKDSYPKIVRHLRYRGARRDIAESLAQETFVKAVERLDTLRDPDKALAWLRRVAENLFYDRYRKEGGDRLLEPDPEEAAEKDETLTRDEDALGLTDSDDGWKHSPERVLIEQEHRQRLEAMGLLLPTLLPPNQRRAMLLRYTEDLSYAEIAHRLGMSAATARTHVKRAKQRLEALVKGKTSKVVVRPLGAWQELAEARARAGDRVGAARAHALVGWNAAGASLGLSAALRESDPEGRILEDPTCRDSGEAVVVRELLATAREEVSQAVEVFEAAGLHDEAADAWLGLGLGFHHAELYEEARPALLAALADLRETQRTNAEHRSEMAFVLRTLGCVCTGLSLFEEGLKSFRRALRIFQGLGDEEESARTLMQGAELFVKKGDRGAARQAYRRALKLCRRFGAGPETEAFIEARLASLGGG